MSILFPCVLSRKQRPLSHNVPGWKLFGKVPPKQSPSKQSQVIQQVKTVKIKVV